jgi:hypothetical protein
VKADIFLICTSKYLGCLEHYLLLLFLYLYYDSVWRRLKREFMPVVQQAMRAFRLPFQKKKQTNLRVTVCVDITIKNGIW